MTTGVATTRTTIPVTIHGVRLDMCVSVGGLDALTSRAVDRRSGVSGSANLPSPRVFRHGAAPSFRGAGFWCVRGPATAGPPVPLTTERSRPQEHQHGEHAARLAA